MVGHHIRWENVIHWTALAAHLTPCITWAHLPTRPRLPCSITPRGKCCTKLTSGSMRNSRHDACTTCLLSLHDAIPAAERPQQHASIGTAAHQHAHTLASCRQNSNSTPASKAACEATQSPARVGGSACFTRKLSCCYIVLPGHKTASQTALLPKLKGPLTYATNSS